MTEVKPGKWRMKSEPDHVDIVTRIDENGRVNYLCQFDAGTPEEGAELNSTQGFWTAEFEPVPVPVDADRLKVGSLWQGKVIDKRVVITELTGDFVRYAGDTMGDKPYVADRVKFVALYEPVEPTKKTDWSEVEMKLQTLKETKAEHKRLDQVQRQADTDYRAARLAHSEFQHTVDEANWAYNRALQAVEDSL